MQRDWCQATRLAGSRGAPSCSLRSARRQRFLPAGTCVVSGCARVCLRHSPAVSHPEWESHVCHGAGGAPARVVFLSLGVSVCAVWCLWVCLHGLCWCVARHVCA